MACALTPFERAVAILGGLLISGPRASPGAASCVLRHFVLTGYVLGEGEFGDIEFDSQSDFVEHLAVVADRDLFPRRPRAKTALRPRRRGPGQSAETVGLRHPRPAVPLPGEAAAVDSRNRGAGSDASIDLRKRSGCWCGPVHARGRHVFGACFGEPVRIG